MAAGRRAVAVHVHCNACGNYSRIAIHDDAWDEFTAPIGGWWVAHRGPRLVAVDVLEDGRMFTAPANTLNKENRE